MCRTLNSRDAHNLNVKKRGLKSQQGSRGMHFEKVGK
jgi:hypothetical protein